MSCVANIVFAIFATSVLSARAQFLERCGTLDCSTLRCCQMDAVQAGIKAIGDKVKECMTLPQESCQRAICIGTKLGYGNPDGTIDKAKATEMITGDFSSNGDILALLKEKCIDSDISAYGPPPMCDVLKFQYCTRVQILGKCNNWDTNGDCAGIKAKADECYKMMS